MSELLRESLRDDSGPTGAAELVAKHRRTGEYFRDTLMRVYFEDALRLNDYDIKRTARAIGIARSTLTYHVGRFWPYAITRPAA